MCRWFQVSRSIFVVGAAVAAILIAFLGSTTGQTPRTIVEEWRDVQAPPPPSLRGVSVDPATTALLILDVQQQNCNLQRRPRCLPTVPRIRILLGRAAARGMSIIYSTMISF